MGRRIAVIHRHSTRPDRQPMVAGIDHGMIRPEGRSRRGPHMSATPDSTLVNPEQLVADLQRQLAECRAELYQRTAERDEALEQQTATAEVLQVIQRVAGQPISGVRCAARQCNAPVRGRIRCSIYNGGR